MVKLADAIRATIEEHLPGLLEEQRERGVDWTLGHIGDFICVVNVEDAGDGMSAGFEVHSRCPTYRRIGLLQWALMDMAGDMARDE